MTYCAFVTTNIQADQATMLENGVVVDRVIAYKGGERTGLISSTVTIPDPIPHQLFFHDLDGNRFLLVQPD